MRFTIINVNNPADFMLSYLINLFFKNNEVERTITDGLHIKDGMSLLAPHASLNPTAILTFK